MGNTRRHIEHGETPLEAAKRELYEETGAICFDIVPLCDCASEGILDGISLKGNGQVYSATVHTLGQLPISSEMEKISLLDSPPEKLTYPKYIDKILPIISKMKCPL